MNEPKIQFGTVLQSDLSHYELRISISPQTFHINRFMISLDDSVPLSKFKSKIDNSKWQSIILTSNIMTGQGSEAITIVKVCVCIKNMRWYSIRKCKLDA